MHEKNAREAIDGVLGLCGALIKDWMKYRRTIKTKEKDFELRKELEEVKAKAEARKPVEELPPQDQEGGASDLPGTQAGVGLGSAIDRLEGHQQCGICQSLLQAIRQMNDTEKQAVALAEYGEFLGRLESGASDQEIREVLEKSDELSDLLEQIRSQEM